MKKIIALGCFFLMAETVKSQSVQFSPLSWRQALAKAKTEHKILFIDMYTTWCTYCKQMEQSVFSDTAVAGYYNKHFINIRYDALKNDGIEISKTYTLLGFPTFLYLDPNGLVILKTAGYQQKEKFIYNGDSAFRLQQNKLHLSQQKMLN